jgi:AcrR family transcriptional regulator
MARAFTEDEKTLLRRRLLEVGRDLFIMQGLKKTSLEEITQPLGIAKSSFYLFFSSKEDLYLELLMQERARIEKQVMAATFQSTADVQEALVRFLKAVLQEIETNTLTRRLITHPEEHAQLSRYGSPASWATNTQDAVLKVLPFIEQGQARRELIDGDPTLLIRVLLTVPLLLLHKEVIGEESYTDVIDTLIHLLTRGMMREVCP